MKSNLAWKRNAQLIVILLCALTLKLYYSTASVNDLRWILAPTTVVVELVSGSRFEFESHAGYINSDRTFVIAASCAGVNFLITSFLMLSLRKLWRARSQNLSHNLAWSFIPAAALFAYLATLIANTVRISTALRLHGRPLEISWLSPNQLHRFEGIFIYFGFLLLLFMVSEKMSYRTGSGQESIRRQPAWVGGCDRMPSLSSKNSSVPARPSGWFRQSLFPLLIYYTTTLGIPLANGAYRQGADFWEHSLFVLLTPPLLMLPLAAFRFFRGYRDQPAPVVSNVSAASSATTRSVQQRPWS